MNFSQYSLLLSTGNTVTQKDLVSQNSSSLGFQNSHNIETIAISCDNNYLFSSDQSGRAIIYDVLNNSIIGRINLKSSSKAAQWSPNGKFIAISNKNQVHVWRFVPSDEFSPLVLHRKYTGFFDSVITIAWSPDSCYFVAGSADRTCRVFSLDTIEGFRPFTLGGHRESIIGVYFESNGSIYTLGVDGALFHWNFLVQENKWKVDNRTFFEQTKSRKTYITCCQFLSPKPKEDLEEEEVPEVKVPEVKVPEVKVPESVPESFPTQLFIAAGFANGIIGLFALPDLENLTIISVSQKMIRSIALDSTGCWIGFRSSELFGVWDWKTETYLLKENTQSSDMDTIDISPDGNSIVTGSNDGLIKLWDSNSSHCVVTFDQHTGPISSVKFTQNGNVIVSASLDGTVRCFDTLRYRQFKILSAKTPVSLRDIQSKDNETSATAADLFSKQDSQFSCLAVDPSGDLICAGSLAIGGFRVYLWSMRQGKLLETLAGHSAPVSCLQFSPSSSILASGSWDGTVRLWDIFNKRHGSVNPLLHDQESDVLALDWSRDGKMIVTATLNGYLNFWDAETHDLNFVMDCKRDLWPGIRRDDVTSIRTDPKKAQVHFTTVKFTPDNSRVIASGKSNYICIYHIQQRVLLRRIRVSSNLSLDGILQRLNSSLITPSGLPVELLDTDTDDPEHRTRNPLSNRSSTSATVSSRFGGKSYTMMSVKDIAVSPSGKHFAVVTPVGLYFMTEQPVLEFDPVNITVDINPKTIFQSLKKNRYNEALIMSLRLNEYSIISSTILSIPVQALPPTIQHLTTTLLVPLFDWISTSFTKQVPYISLILEILSLVFKFHSISITDSQIIPRSALNAVQKHTASLSKELSTLCNSNKYLLHFIGQMKVNPEEEEEEE